MYTTLDIAPGTLTRRWYPMVNHAGQQAYANSEARNNVVPAGRRSGKSEMAKRRIVLRALCCHIQGHPFELPYVDPKFGIGAPTVAQVKAIYWDDIKAMIPVRFMFGKPNESSLEIRLINGASIRLYGMDRPERAEGGTGFSGFILDEYGNMKPDVWEAHLQPTLIERNGWCDLIGVPEGRNHYYDLYVEAQRRALDHPDLWLTHHWTSETVIPLYNERGAEELAAAKKTMDEITYRQEYLGSFENFTGRAYYGFLDDNKAKLAYHPRRPIALCLDFNVEPAVAAVLQEQPLPLPGDPIGTGAIGEVWIPRGGNVLTVADRFITDFGKHEGPVILYGDATGGARGAGKVLGSEWELVKRRLRAHYKPGQVSYRVPKQNPRERDRVASMNSRFRNFDGEIRFMVDPRKCPKLIKDFEGVCVVQGGSGELDKSNLTLTHLSDACGYYMTREFPIKRTFSTTPGRRK